MYLSGNLFDGVVAAEVEDALKENRKLKDRSIIGILE